MRAQISELHRENPRIGLRLTIDRLDLPGWTDAMPAESEYTAGRSNAIIRAVAALLRVRWFVRAPIWLYRARLGVVFGGRLLMLEHVGRKSGQKRYVVLEIVDHPTADRYVVVSGFGDRAQWFRNLEANPLVRICLAGHKPASAIARRLDTGASAASLNRYAAAHPRSWAKLRPILEQTLGTRIGESGTELPMIAFDLVGRGTAPSAPDR